MFKENEHPTELLHHRYRLIKTLHVREGHPTYLAEDTQSDPTSPLQVIIKQLNLGQVKEWSELELFEREVNTLAQLKHPQIPKLLDHFRDDSPEVSACYLVQTAIAGKTLRKTLDEEGPLNEAEVTALAHQILDILSYLHALNPPVIHRDIKPDNLIVDPQGQVHLIDFGAVRDATLMNQMTVAGTFGYMPPEQAAGQVKPATDIYALGVTLIEGLTGCAPHVLPQNQQLRLLYHDRVVLSDTFKRWLDVLTDPVIDQRPRNAQEALHWLKAKALPESIGRLQINYPKPGRVDLIVSTQHTASPQQLVWKSLQNQIVKALGYGIVYWAFAYSILFLGINAPGSIGYFFMMIMGLHPLSLGFLAILSWLTFKEYEVLKAQSLHDVRVSLEGDYLFYGAKAYRLSALSGVDYEASNNHRVVAINQTTLRFKGSVLALPVRFTKAEEQLFEHVLQKHRQTQGLTTE